MVDINEINAGGIIYAGPSNATPCKVVEVRKDGKVICIMGDSMTSSSPVRIVLSPEECFKTSQDD